METTALALLKGVSRSFYLSVRVLPARLRHTVALTYLVARAADTIADTEIISADERLAQLQVLRACIARDPKVTLSQIELLSAQLGEHAHAQEKQLLQNLKNILQ